MKKIFILLILSISSFKSFASSNPTLEQDIGYCYGFIVALKVANPDSEIIKNGAFEEIKAIIQLKSIEMDEDNAMFLGLNYYNTFAKIVKESENSSDAGYTRIFKTGWNSCAKIGISRFGYMK